MTANHSVDLAQFLTEHLERAKPDLLRRRSGRSSRPNERRSRQALRRALGRAF